ncbi:anti-sigma factor family protein [Corallococcus interemptor]|uniref:anti-sigma factor family protein n=1 Tax=Corallococcus interemptor TaxID=2316720 RepID=UPI003CFD1E1F
MNAQNAHAHEDRLLDFAYGELPASEAHALEQHVQGCARCTKALADIRGVRTTMAQLSSEPAPDAGLESLLAYAQQSARRAAAGPEPKPSRWRRWLLPVVGLATVSTFGILTLTVSENLKLEPNLSQKAAPSAAMAAKKEETQARLAPSPVAAAPEPLELSASQGYADAMEAAPKRNVADRPQAELKAMPKGSTAAARPSDWMNAGGGGALLERRRSEAEAPRKKVAPAVRDADGEFAALEPAPAPVVAESVAPKEEEADEDAFATARKDARASEGSADKAKVAKADSLRMGTKAYGRGLSLDDAESPSMAGATPPPPPPPPAAASAPVAQAMPSAPSAATGSIGGMAPGTEAAKPKPLEKSAGAMTARDLSAQAQAAADQGDRAREAQLLRAALAAGASGSERLALLSRLCESESVQGRAQEAATVCGQIISEAPGSSAAQLAQRRLRQASPPATPAKAAPSKKLSQ